MKATLEHKRPERGDVVIYVDPDMRDEHPGVVTKPLNEGRALLTVFPVGNVPRPVGPVTHDQTGKAPGTWHWRE